MIPNEYLYFYYHAADTVAALRSGLESRAEFLVRQQAGFYRDDGRSPEDALAVWRATRREREQAYFAEARAAAGVDGPHETGEEDGGYEREALAVVEAIAQNECRVLILNAANRSALPFLDERAVVEVPCVVGRRGAMPVAIGEVPAHARALVEAVKAVERLTIRAAIRRSRVLALEAIALHPLVPSVNAARRILDAYVERQPQLRELLA